MTPKEVFEHEWHNGDKVYVAVCEYYNLFGDGGEACKFPLLPEALNKKAEAFIELPVCVAEGTVCNFEQSGVKMDWNHVKFDIELDYKSCSTKIKKNRVTYLSHICSAFVTYGTSCNRYDHQKLCANIFLTKNEAEKRIKQLIKKWNKGMEELQAIQKRETKRMENELAILKKYGNNYFSKFLIK